MVGWHPPYGSLSKLTHGVNPFISLESRFEHGFGSRPGKARDLDGAGAVNPAPPLNRIVGLVGERSEA